MKFFASLFPMVAQLRVGLVLVGFGVLAAALAGQTYRLDRAQTALLIEQAAHVATDAQLTTANASLTAMEAHGARLDEAAKRAEAKLNAAARSFADKVQRIQAVPAPTSCEAAMDLLRKDAAGDL